MLLMGPPVRGAWRAQVIWSEWSPKWRAMLQVPHTDPSDQKQHREQAGEAKALDPGG